MRGRRPLPTGVKLFRGTMRPGRANRDEPRLTLAVPACPDYLSAAAKRVWAELVAAIEPLRVLTLADQVLLAHFADVEAKHRKDSAELERRGPTYKTASGMERVRPLVGVVADEDRRCKAYCEAFGLGPAARARVHAQPPAPKDGDDGWAALLLPGARGGRSA